MDDRERYIVKYVLNVDVYVTVKADNERQAKERADKKLARWNKSNLELPNLGGMRFGCDTVWTSTERQGV